MCPVHGIDEYRARLDALLVFFLEAFLNEELFDDGDSLNLALPGCRTRYQMTKT